MKSTKVIKKLAVLRFKKKKELLLWQLVKMKSGLSKLF